MTQVSFTQWLNGLVLGSLAFATLTACEPKDMSVKRTFVSPYTRAKIERSQTNGLDYVQYTAYRLGEVARLAEFVMQTPAQTVQAAGTKSCGRLVVDEVQGSRRMMRLQTRECELSTSGVQDLKLTADGDETIDVQLDNENRVVRIWATTIGPYLISGKIAGKTEMKDSAVSARERREMGLDLLASHEGVDTYRFAYSVELNFRQDLVTKDFKAFEDNGRNQLNLSGEIQVQNGVAIKMTLDSVRANVNVPREITERGRRNNSAPGKTFHNVSLSMEAQPGAEKGTFEPLVLDAAKCALPLGKLVVANYSNSTTDSKLDKLTKGRDGDIEFTTNGLKSSATGAEARWHDCAEGVTAPAVPGEVGNRSPYTALFFK